MRTADRLGTAGYVTVQSRYNLLYREIETELLPLCRDQGVVMMVYNPLAGGFLSGKYRAGQGPEDGTRFTLGKAADMYQQRYWQESQFTAVESLKQVAEARGIELVSLAVAWVLANPECPPRSSVLPRRSSSTTTLQRSMWSSTTSWNRPAEPCGGDCRDDPSSTGTAREALRRDALVGWGLTASAVNLPGLIGLLTQLLGPNTLDLAPAIYARG